MYEHWIYVFVNWILQPKTGSPYSTGFSTEDAEGSIVSASVNGYPIIFNVTYRNESSISVSLVIERPITLDGTTISCGGEMLVLNVQQLRGQSSKFPSREQLLATIL